MLNSVASELSQETGGFTFHDFQTIIFARSKRPRTNGITTEIGALPSFFLTGKERNIVILTSSIEDATSIIDALKATEQFDDISPKPSHRYQDLAIFLFNRPQHFCDITGLRARDLNNLEALERFTRYRQAAALL